MYQITALYQDCEIAYAEGEDFQEVLSDLADQISDGSYTELPADDIDLSIIKEGAVGTIQCKASLYW